MSAERFLTRLREAIEGEPPAAVARVLEEITQEHLKLHRRLNKISRISDGYQEQLRDLNRKLHETNQELSQALVEVKTLRGLIPICARCKRIRDDHGLWDQIETYISQHSEAVFSHGVCPECAKVLFPTLRPGTQDIRRSAPGPSQTEPGPEEAEVGRRLEALRQDPSWVDHPLLAELDWLGDKHLRLVRRLMKISKISDGFQRELKGLNATLQESSRTDYLTGLANRREMMGRLKAEMSRAKRGRLPLTILMADVDRFKHINDTFGHEAGDLVLQVIATNLRAALRDYDVCSRWGGEEFLVLLPETNLEEGSVAGEKLREKISRIEVNHEFWYLGATVSLGLACYRWGETHTSLLHRADEAMYEAKRLGRNRLEVAP
jgi:diguanylate cyclase (GGDEF)-like protein